MHPKIAHLSRPILDQDRRGAPRRVIKFGLDLVDVRAGSTILIRDMSRTGLLIECDVDLELDETIELDIPETGSVEAKVVRRAGNRYGAEFRWPISNAAVSASLLVAPAAPIPKGATQSSLNQNLESGETSLLYLLMGLLLIAVCAFLYALASLPIGG